MRSIRQEWNGTLIEILNTIKRVELRVDGKTQDYFDGVIVPNGECIRLEAKGKRGEKIRVIFEKSMILLTKYTIYYNERKIKSGIVR